MVEGKQKKQRRDGVKDLRAAVERFLDDDAVRRYLESDEGSIMQRCMDVSRALDQGLKVRIKALLQRNHREK